MLPISNRLLAIFVQKHLAVYTSIKGGTFSGCDSTTTQTVIAQPLNGIVPRVPAGTGALLLPRLVQVLQEEANGSTEDSVAIYVHAKL